MINKSEYTINTEEKKVSLKEFRAITDHLFRIVRTDYKACTTKEEKENCIDTAKVIGSKLISSVCYRASIEDWDRRERAIELSFNIIAGWL